MIHTKEEKLAAFSRLLDVQDRLRLQCPWDKKQTFESLRPNTIEETFELCDALMKRDYKDIKKELGDVLEHVMFYSIIGREDGEFDICDVCNQEADKLMFRHPFINWNEEGEWSVSNPDMYINENGQVVYKEEKCESEDSASDDDQNSLVKAGSVKPKTSTAVEKTWEQIKQQEKDGNERVLSGVPNALPSLIKAYRIQDKARNVGFDWKNKEDVWDKVQEELDELKIELAKEDKENSTKELGDFLFSVINAARLYKLNPDNALEHTNQKFIRRFNYVEDHTLKKGKNLKDISLEEMDQLWNEAKSLEKNEVQSKEANKD
ncbi:nucleoside triphosphate pyrophosphohydrolase [Segatella hominis]|uniref:nucleoside triphosphate pyrophosphohydrolase n=1 Tax=Segatella hominis TaxID=2518605 RepID=UPI003AB08B00